MMDIQALIASNLAMPATYRVLTTYADGRIRQHDVRSLAAAKNWATGERRKIGRDLISRETGETVRVVSVDIVVLA
jgi:hypothetical protein